MSIIQKIPLILLVWWLISIPGFSNDNGDWKDKVSPEVLGKLRIQHRVNCLIYLKEQQHFPRLAGAKTDKGRQVFSSLSSLAASSQKEIRKYFQGRGENYRSYFIVNALSAPLDEEGIRTLSGMDEVAYISLDEPVRTLLPGKDPDRFHPRNGMPEWGLQVIKADSVWALGITGENAVIGGQDTGYDWSHPAIKTKYRGYINENEADHNYNWHDAIHEISPLHNDSIVDPSNNPCGLNVPYPCDDQSHGTHTMGTMVGLDGDNIIGVAPGAKWIGVRNMERGWGKPSTYLEGFEWFLAPTDLQGLNPDPSKAPHVINNSWSCPAIEGCDSTNWIFMDMAINHLREAGIVVVVSAGNNGNNCGRINAPPSMLEGSFAVAATQVVDTVDGEFIDGIAGYSSWGPVMVDNSYRLKPDISAPGSRVRSSVPGNNYSTASGTSMAGPHVAGVVALMISANPDLAGDVDKIEEIIQLTADPMTRDFSCGDLSGNSIPNFVYGYGRINALAAVKTAQNISTSVLDEAIDNTGFFIFPNPVSGYLRASWSGTPTAIIAKIISQEGQHHGLIRLEKNVAYPVSFLPSGVYFLKTALDNRMITRKFIVQ